MAGLYSATLYRRRKSQEAHPARDGLTGVTSNPSIFEKAIAGSSDYDSSVKRIVAENDVVFTRLYDQSAVQDIQNSADLLLSVFDAKEGADRYL